MQETLALQALCVFQSDHVCILFRQIPSDPYSSELSLAESQKIDTMCISPAEETLAISTDRGQLYSCSLSSLEMNKVEQSLLPATPLCLISAVLQKHSSRSFISAGHRYSRVPIQRV